ncbi:MAG TPA: hypothetical protein VGK24_08000 [Candidatus Angelobacter sp.]|jgi:Spy/CpxP family protein refolding chaperone
MKPMRLIILFAACLFTMAAIAQQNPPSQENGDHKHGGQMHQGMPSVDDHVKDLTTKLNLTPDQQTKMKAILEDTHQQADSVMKDQSMSKEDKQAKMKELHESAKTKARDILTDDQKPKFDAMMKDMEAQMHSRHDGDKAPK